MNYSEPLICSQYYHLFNHAVGKDNLFVERENYLYFLKKFGEYADPICQTYSYCLMPNHFHFLVRIRDEKELLLFYRTLKKEVQKEEVDLSKVVMQRFSNLFNAYAKAFNKKYRRRGSLFIDYLKRKHV
ncbi:MAG: transposase, partial [Cytophagaceae bacterium]